MLKPTLLLCLPVVWGILCTHTTCRLVDVKGRSTLRVFHSRVEQLCAHWSQITPHKLHFKNHGKLAQKQCAVSEMTGLCECHLYGTHPYSHYRKYEPLTSLRVTMELTGLTRPMFSAAVQRGVVSAFALELRVPPKHVTIRDVRDVQPARLATAVRRRVQEVEEDPAVALVGAELVDVANDIVGSTGPEGEEDGNNTEREVALGEARDSVVFDVYIEAWTSRAAKARELLNGAKVSNDVQGKFALTMKREIVNAVLNSGRQVGTLRSVHAAFGAVVILEKAAAGDVLNCKAGTIATKDCGDHSPGTKRRITSTKTCGELGWATGHGANDGVCGASQCQYVLAQNRRSGGSTRVAATFDAAQKTCRAEGARLCTVAELEANETKGTGCGHDNRLIWTATPCGNGQDDGQSYRQFGKQAAGRSGLDRTCTAHGMHTGHVRCCADKVVVTPITVTLEACIRTCELTVKCASWSFRQGPTLLDNGDCFLLDKSHSGARSEIQHGFRSAVCTEGNAVCAACPNTWAVTEWHGPPAQACEVKACDKRAGTILNARENRCDRCPNAFVVSRWADADSWCKIAACVSGYYLSDLRCMRCRNKHAVAKWAKGINCTVSVCRLGWFVDLRLNKCSPDRIKWKVVFARGTAGNFDVGAEELQRLVERSPTRMVKRICTDCDEGYKVVIYKRTSDRKANLWALFHQSFVSTNNKLHTDFELYSTEADAKADVNGWTWCNYDHKQQGVGFPRDCGKLGRAKAQWNSLASVAKSRNNYAFYVDAGDAIGKSLALPALTWAKVFSKSPSAGTSFKTCAELGWQTHHGADDAVCAASHCRRVLAQQPGVGKERSLLATTFDAAQKLCRAEGARLCTVQELEAHETRSTGCGHDHRRVWSSTSCGWGRSFTQYGWSGHGAEQSNCESHASPSGFVRCCADASTNVDIGKGKFQEAVESSRYKMVKRICADCAPEYQQVIYMRTGLAYGDYYDLFHHAWVRRRNALHRDFELFSSDADALAHKNTWGFCNYAQDNRNGIGFPRECGIRGKVKFQWNSLTHTAASRKSYSFFVSN